MRRSLSEAVSELDARIRRSGDRRFPVLGLKGAAGALMLAETAERLKRPIIVVTPDERGAEALVGDLEFFMAEPVTGDADRRRIHLLRSWELKPFARLSPPSDVQASSFAALYAILRHPVPIVVTPVDALMRRTIPRAVFEESVLKVSIGDRLDLEVLVDELAGSGYQRVPLVEEPGDFSVRGGTVDVFSPLLSDPVRFELDDDEVVSVRRFEAADQRSLSELSEAGIVRTRFIPPRLLRDGKLKEQVALRSAELKMVRKEAAELLERLETGVLFPGVELLIPYAYGRPLDSLFDFLPEDTLCWMVEPGRVAAEAANLEREVEAAARAARAKPAFHPEPRAMYLGAEELAERLEKFPVVEAGSIVTVMPLRAGWATAIEVQSAPSLNLVAGQDRAGRRPPSFAPLARELKEVERGQGRAVMIVEGGNQVARLKGHLEAYDIEVNTEVRSFADLRAWPDHRPAIIEGGVSAGTILERDGIYIYSEEDIFGEPRLHRRRLPRRRGARLSLEGLKSGDFVVHIDHGIARYRGLRHLRVAGVEGDFLNLEYAGDDTMYVPVERINQVQRYVGTDGVAPKLDRLGSGSWEKVKKRTRESVLAMAAELLEVYAAREVENGHAFPAPGSEMEEFAAGFGFEETPDQRQAIEDVLADMARPRPMDRLICGDAGFGKTEVALRAALVAVMGGKQVAVLVPTTVLAEQHWNTIRVRFKDYPVRVEMVSRFRSPVENRATIADLARGRVDIVVGTHRLLQRDVEIPNLGLLVIDEEHRFGVADKERIKRLKKLVEVLTMTATPIPRTLSMAMLGIRDLSVIETAPPDRQAIRTFVAHFDDGLLREVILRELNRGGQVFFVHNRVENIEYMAEHLRGLVPEARLAVAHGKMRGRRLEDVMRAFIENRVNLLVCSAIIESGLDIPNANTIIINRADRLGLAQLYQLRGRVGRARQRAYAYLLIPGEHIITRDARRRIEVLRELVESQSGGGGFKLAMSDLEHRGAGNLLGREQSGQIAAVGFELYTEMMEEAIAELKGRPREVELEPELKLAVPAYIPESYVPDEGERLQLYRRLARARSRPELDELEDEMRDRFGPVPTLVRNVLRVMDLRCRMREMMMTSAILRGGRIEFRFHPAAPVDGRRLRGLADQNRATVKLTPSSEVLVRLQAQESEEIFDEIESVLRALASCENLEGQAPKPQQAAAG